MFKVQWVSPAVFREIEIEQKLASPTRRQQVLSE